jgi:hypothetical protein
MGNFILPDLILLMKNLLLSVFFVLGCIGFARPQEMELISPNYRFKPGMQTQVFGSRVRLRAQPNLNAQIIAELDMGHRVRILEESSELGMYNGLEMPWYRVETGAKTGFVLGGLLALQTLSFGSTYYLVSLAEDSMGVWLKTRLMLDDKRHLERSDLLKTPEFYLSVSDGRGLNGVQSILEADYLAEACGVDGGGFLLFYTHATLIKAIEFVQVGDADVFSLVEAVLFPKEEGGRPDGIYFKRKQYELLDEETEWSQKLEMSVFLPWKGVPFVVPK